jgi:2-(1,2-epoxy-1,2-dihydrophenyl)acetyl-CoA isomerase
MPTPNGGMAAARHRENTMTGSASAPVISTIEDGVGIVTLNRPDTRNAINRELASAWAREIDWVVEHAGVRAIVLRAAGPAFSVGGDIALFGEHLGAGLAPLLDVVIDHLNAAAQQLRDSDKPVVSAVQGALAGGGIGMALSADVVIGGGNLKLRGGYAAIGLSPDAGASCFLAERVGDARACALLMTNRTLGADECAALGIVDRLVPTDALHREAYDLARQLAQMSGSSIRTIKSLCKPLRGFALAGRLRAERDGMLRSARHEDAAEGIGAFMTKRKPVFGKTS